MVKTFVNRDTRDLYLTGRSRRLPAEIAQRAARKLDAVNAASRLDGLRVPPGNRLHALSEDRVGQHAIFINAQWRIRFRFQEGDAYDVEVCVFH